MNYKVYQSVLIIIINCLFHNIFTIEKIEITKTLNESLEVSNFLGKQAGKEKVIDDDQLLQNSLNLVNKYQSKKKDYKQYSIITTFFRKKKFRFTQVMFFFLMD